MAPVRYGVFILCRLAVYMERQNLDARTRTVKVRPPKSKYFVLREFFKPTSLAGGLETRFEVFFDGDKFEPDRQSVQDKIVIQTETGSYDLQARPPDSSSRCRKGGPSIEQLKATAPKADVRILGDLIMGLLPSDSKASKTIQLVNDGSAHASFRVEWDRNLPIIVEPNIGVVDPGGQPVDLTVTVTVGDAGSLASEITVVLGSITKKVMFTATIIKQSFDLVDSSGAILTELDFGSLYYGQTSEREVTLFNNGPVEARYIISYGTLAEMRSKVDDEAAANADPNDPFADVIMAARQRQKARNTGDNPFHVTPLSGVIAPYSKASVSVRYTPSAPQAGKGFTCLVPSSDQALRTFEYFAVVELLGLPTKMKLPIRARGMPGGLRLSSQALAFGDVATHNWADQLLGITNTNSQMGARYQMIKSTPYFSVDPSSGSILPGGNIQVVVRYHPKAMGKHKGTIPIKVLSEQGEVIQELALELSGTSLRMGEKDSLVGGTDKLPQDFERPRNFVDDEQVMLTTLEARKKSTRLLTKTWDKPELADAYKETSTKETMSRAQAAAAGAHKEKYTTFMRAQRTAREEQRKNGRVDEDDVNLGMDTRSGLLAPEPKLSRTVDPLWRVDASKEAAPRMLRQLGAADLEGAHQWKPRPQSEQERIDCSRELSKDELARLVVGPRIVDFGKVSMGSTNTRHLVMQNTLDGFINVVLDIKHLEMLRDSPSISQVIPPGAKADFPLVLQASEIRSVNEKVEYVVNGNHVLSFPLSADIVPVNLDFSAEDLNFQFSLDNWDEAVEKILILDNPHKFPVNFTVESTNTCFQVSAGGGGIIRSQSSVEVVVRWAPDMMGPPKQEGFLIIKMVGGEAPKRIYMTGELPEGNVRPKDKELVVSVVPVGIQQSTVLQIKNHGSRDTAFRFLSNEELITKPSSGRIAADETLDIEVLFTANEPGTFLSCLALEMRGGNIVKIPFRAEAVVPNVEIEQDEFNFGSVFVGSSSRLPLTLRNTSQVAATLMIDLVAHPDLQLLCPKDAWSTAEYEACPLEAIGPAGSQVLGSRFGSGRVSRSGSRRQSSSLGFRSMSYDGFKYRITINPCKELPLLLDFRPMEQRDRDVELAFHLVTAGGNSVQPVRKVATGKGMSPRIILSKTLIDFANKVVIRSNQLKAPYVIDLYVTNQEEKPVVVSFGEPVPAPHAAGLPVKGIYSMDLAPMQSLEVQAQEMVGVQIRFCPRDSRTYEALIPVYLDGATDAPYLNIEVQGVGQYPRLSFDVRECLLPPVPLGLRSTATFFVVNNGYDNLELKYKLPADEGHLPMEVEFPEGTIIGLAKDRLPVVVSFMSPKPMSFTANIDFMDEDGKRFSMSVTGTTDNSLLTHGAFMAVNKSQLVFSHEPGMPVFLEEAAYVLPAPPMCLGPEVPCRGVARYLNATTTRGPFDNLGQQMMVSRGKLLLEIVEMLSGKSVPGKIFKLNNNRKEAVRQLLLQYDAVLVFLKSHGCLLNAVKPEMLLEYEDFCRVMNERSTAATDNAEELEALEMWSEVEMNFATVSAQAWNSMVLQIFKVFVLGRVTLKSLRTLPGSENLELPPDSSIIGSNFYSVAESALLAWMSAHCTREFGPKFPRITNFDSDLADASVLFALLSGYWPGLEKKKKTLRLDCRDDQDKRENAEMVLKIMTDLGLPYDITVDEIVNPNPHDMMVFVLYLHHTLPQFVPRSCIDFACKLGETQCKELELTNPSKKAISYSARLEGHRDFSIESSSLRIEPKAAAKLMIQCTPTNTLSQASRLVLMSKREGGVHAATLVFQLACKVNTRAPLKRVRTEGPLYELQVFEFTVTNPFPAAELKYGAPAPDLDVRICSYGFADGDFTIQILHEPAEPLPKKEEDPAAAKVGPGSAARSRATSKRSGRKAQQFELPTAEEVAAKWGRLWPDAFGLDRNRLRLKQNASERIKGFFLPFTMTAAYCTVLFRDKEQGEFCYELVGEPGLPSPMMQVKGNVPLEAPQQVYDLLLPFQNSALEAAKRAFQEKHPLAKDKEQLSLLKQDPFKGNEIAYLVTQTNSLMSAPSHISLSARSLLVYATEPLPTSPPNGPGGAVQSAASGGANGNSGGGGANSSRSGGQQRTPNAMPPPEPNTLRLHLSPIGTGIYPTRIMLTSALDVRVIDVELTAQTMTQNFVLEFSTSARQPITQASRAGDIPLVNTGETSMTVSATINGAIWSGPREMIVPAGCTVMYPLQFKPLLPGDIKGSLELAINATGERNTYTLLGRASEPLAEGQIVIECQARKPATKQFNVPNIIGSSTEYKVMCDLDFMVGVPQVKVPPGLATQYKITACPQRSGTYNGIITFTTADGQYCWYTLEVRASEPPEVGTIDVRAAVRTAVVVCVTMSNPLRKDMELAVRYSDVALCGPAVVALPGTQEPVTFEFFFAPLVPGSSSGSVVLVNDDVGEFRYLINMVADPAEPEQLPDMTAELGRSGRSPLVIENPLDVAVVLSATSSNPRNFAVLPSMVALSAYGTAELMVEYCPSTLDHDEEATITVDGDIVGTWEYNVRGRGELPTVMEATHMSTMLGAQGQVIVTWKNPFPEAASVSVQLRTDEPPGVFELLRLGPYNGASSSKALTGVISSNSSSNSVHGGVGPGPGGGSGGHAATAALALGNGPLRSGGASGALTVQEWTVQPYGLLHVPLRYTPAALKTCSCEVLVAVEGSSYSLNTLVWRFPVRALTEASLSGVVFRYKCKARSRIEETMEVVLTGLNKVGPEDEFSHEMVLPVEHRAFLEQSLVVEPVGPNPVRLSRPDAPLRYKVYFAPQRMLPPTSLELVINKSTGGRWRFEMQLQATEPDLDGTLTIEAAVGATSYVPLRLYSSSNEPQPFTASFPSDTPLVFNVVPSKGLLPPMPRPGEPEPEPPLQVSYNCREFGKVVRGRLHVQTSDMHYSYELRGRMPTYVPPSPAQFATSVDNKLDPALETRLSLGRPTGKNYVATNMRATRVTGHGDQGGGHKGQPGAQGATAVAAKKRWTQLATNATLVASSQNIIGKSWPTFGVIKGGLDRETPSAKLQLLERLQAREGRFLSPVVRDGVPEGVRCDATERCDSHNVCARVCARGSVAIDPWLRFAVDYQWRLSRKQPLCFAQLLGTHNSAITLADGYGMHDDVYTQYLHYLGLASGSQRLMTNNQVLSLTDQLNLGVRFLELDVHWIQSDLHIAHCGGFHSPQLNALVAALSALAQLFGHPPVEWDAETLGCDPSMSSLPTRDQRTFVDALRESEFLVLYLDNQMDLLRWGRVGTLMEQVMSVIPTALIITPPELNNITQQRGSMPSVDELVHVYGKRLLLMSGSDYGEEMSWLAFSHHNLCDMDEPLFRGFQGPPHCQFHNWHLDMDTPVMAGKLIRTPTCNLTYGPYNCSMLRGDNIPQLDDHQLPEATSCGINVPAPDQITPQLVQSYIWSWAPGHAPPMPAAAAAVETQQPKRHYHHPAQGRAVQEAPLASGAATAPSSEGSFTPGEGRVAKAALEKIVSTAEAEAEAVCVVMSSSDGRWLVRPSCKGAALLACRRDTGAQHVPGADAWALASLGPATSAGPCPPGYLPSAPHTARENWELWQLLKHRKQQLLQQPERTQRGHPQQPKIQLQLHHDHQAVHRVKDRGVDGQVDSVKGDGRGGRKAGGADATATATVAGDGDGDMSANRRVAIRSGAALSPPLDAQHTPTTCKNRA
ncbi:hypothetical protein VOLCADRAFT_90100 [Volvox carteri f. nagariensis]|uniref:Uncharacterized protein fap47 n=1 Tax=Volvox carteri f. nagariensis TaxID=3068 RepID=D8TTH2_VOLCA|nr:uncharacterized protein VOLCADRAFT_90100 [Volvox carteri f. nagariensis]EFJ49198.1 hypothetical protein VOLCADRAFT_90100 [Volvox carteri f. nagariensis]|eukprot:XP_002949646.1 hypothetical protein VOLCADRAFT_90100 [Volvox carteri f. nagariensis]